MEKQVLLRKNDILSASEISQYQYCSYSWFLQRCGYKPESHHLELGKQAHILLGEEIDIFEKRLRYSRWYKILGFILLCASFLLVFFGVIL